MAALRRYYTYENRAEQLGSMLYAAAREVLESPDPSGRYHTRAIHGYGDSRDGAIERAERAIRADAEDFDNGSHDARFTVLPHTAARVALGVATKDSSVTVQRPSRYDQVPIVRAARHITHIGQVGLKGYNATLWLRPSATDELQSGYEEVRDWTPEDDLWAAELTSPAGSLARAALLEVGFTPYLEPARFDVGEDLPDGENLFPELQLYTLASRVRS